MRGFTIVELLIVIVVIAILAAIVIVAYNGVQQRARDASMQNELASIGKRIEGLKLQSGSELYPSSLSAAQITPTSEHTYQYSYSANDNSYCLQGSNGQTRSYVSSTQTTVASGSCADNDLVGSWPLNGNATDATTNGLNGTASGVTATTGQNGQANGAYSFPGGSAYINFSNQPQFNQTEFTMSIWMRTTTTTASLQTLMAKETKYKYRLVSGSTLGLLVAPASGWVNRSCTFNYATSTWYHVMWTYSSAKEIAKVYINGNQLCEMSVPAITTSNTQPLMVGSHNTAGAEGFSGSLDDARFYKRALTGAEAKAIFDYGAQ